MADRYRSYERPSFGRAAQGLLHERVRQVALALRRRAGRGDRYSGGRTASRRSSGPDRAGGAGVSRFPLGPEAPAGGARPRDATLASPRRPGAGVDFPPPATPASRLSPLSRSRRARPSSRGRRPIGPPCPARREVRTGDGASRPRSRPSSPKTSRRARSAPAIGARRAKRSERFTRRAISLRSGSRRQGLTPAADSALARLAQADEDGLDLSAFALPKGPLADALARAPRRGRNRHFGGGRRLCDAGERLPPRAGANFAGDLGAAGRGRSGPGVGRGRRRRRSRRRARGLQSTAKGLSRSARPIDAAPRQGADRARRRSRSGPSLGIGMADPRVALVRARLGLGADADAKDPLVYDARLASAVAAFQRANGLAGERRPDAGHRRGPVGQPCSRGARR